MCGRPVPNGCTRIGAQRHSVAYLCSTWSPHQWSVASTATPRLLPQSSRRNTTEQDQARVHLWIGHPGDRPVGLLMKVSAVCAGVASQIRNRKWKNLQRRSEGGWRFRRIPGHLRPAPAQPSRHRWHSDRPPQFPSIAGSARLRAAPNRGGYFHSSLISPPSLTPPRILARPCSRLGWRRAARLKHGLMRDLKFKAGCARVMSLNVSPCLLAVSQACHHCLKM